MRGWRSTTALTCCTARTTVVARPIPESRPCNCCQASSRPPAQPPLCSDSGVRNADRRRHCLGALGATAVGIGRPYAYALSYGGAESLTHYLKSFLAEFDLTLAVCGFKDIATLKAAGCEQALLRR